MQHEGASYSISRTDSTQVERSDLGDFTDQYWIGWASDCQYRIALIETDRPETMRLTAKDTLTFTIVETTGNSRYEYEFELDGHAFTGEVSAVR